MKKNFVIPGLYEHYKLNFYFVNLFKQHPEYFLDNINISAIYGNFSFCTWDGGRIFSQQSYANREQIESLKHLYNDVFQLPMRFIFTNKLIESRDLYDRFNNLILEICNNTLNEVVVNSPLLEQYIRKTYPNYSIISSTTKCITNPNEIIKELKNNNFKYVCLDYNFNKNYNFLESIPDELKSKVELLINPICGAGCKNRANHYSLNSMYALSYGKPYPLSNCKVNKEGTIYPFENNTVIITPEDIEQYYIKHEFCNYKLEGRSFTKPYMILNLVNWMIKKEYQFYVLSILFKQLEIK